MSNQRSIVFPLISAGLSSKQELNIEALTEKCGLRPPIRSTDCISQNKSKGGGNPRPADASVTYKRKL